PSVRLWLRRAAAAAAADLSRLRLLVQRALDGRDRALARPAEGALARAGSVAADQFVAQVVAAHDRVDVQLGSELVEVDVLAVLLAQRFDVGGALALGFLLDLVVVDRVDRGLGA